MWLAGVDLLVFGRLELIFYEGLGDCLYKGNRILGVACQVRFLLVKKMTLTPLSTIWSIIRRKRFNFIEDLQYANDGKHKYVVTITNPNSGRKKKIKFGAYGMEDYTIHKDPERRRRYRQRHKNDHINDRTKPGFYSKLNFLITF
jgi:hypothetical protein